MALSKGTSMRNMTAASYKASPPPPRKTHSDSDSPLQYKPRACPQPCSLGCKWSDRHGHHCLDKGGQSEFFLDEGEGGGGREMLYEIVLSYFSYLFLLTRPFGWY